MKTLNKLWKEQVSGFVLVFLAYLQLLLPRQKKGHTIMSVPNVLIKKMY